MIFYKSELSLCWKSRLPAPSLVNHAECILPQYFFDAGFLISIRHHALGQPC